MAELVGRTLAGRYDIVGFIAMGGMGAVYRARDRELDEMVALKVIRAELAQSVGSLASFRAEVKLARRVTHANVARTYELGRDGEITFCTMELIDGAPLTRRLSVRGMALPEVATIATALCGALEAAHTAGVIHRDLKPDNVLISRDGRTVLTDFGIAAAHATDTEFAGTPRYMAPEQARGAKPTPSADIYALGVMMFEMLGGKPGFTGTIEEILEAKQRIDHLALVGTFDPGIVELVARATAREPELRPRDANAMRQELAPWTTQRDAISPAPPIELRLVEQHVPTLVIRSPTADPEVAHLAYGFRQGLVHRLGRIPHVRVLPRDDARHPGYAIIETTATHGELRLAMTAGSGTSLVLALPIDVAQHHAGLARATRVIAALIEPHSQLPPMPDERPIAPAALDLLLRARHPAGHNQGSLSKMIELCEQALALEPGDPRILASLAKREIELAFMTPDVPKSHALLVAAAEHVHASRAIDPEGAEARLVCGQLELHRGDPVAAAVHFRAGIASDPHHGDSHVWLGRMLIEAGFLVDGFRRLDDAIASSSEISAGWWERARAFALEGRWADVDDTLRELGEQFGAVRGRWQARLRIYIWRGDPGALDDLQRELAEGTTPDRELMVSLTQHMRRQNDHSASIEHHIVRLAASASSRRRALGYQLAAEAFACGGDAARCLDLLERAAGDGLFDLHWLDRCPCLASVRADARFRAVRVVVAQRANAIHDALFGDLDPATAQTGLAVAGP